MSYGIDSAVVGQVPVILDTCLADIDRAGLGSKGYVLEGSLGDAVSLLTSVDLLPDGVDNVQDGVDQISRWC